ncbi:MAG: COX15/CtaA family protein [Bacteroidia bacterium]|nr:COX15/CtaA family protein [Bacteroidia bacterium]
MKTNRAIIIWLYTGCFLVFAMVVVGGITRLTGSGLSITEWNVITGSIPPMSEQHWQEEFLKYQQSPQFKHINSSFQLHDFKAIYWWEYLHRLIGRLMGIIFIVPFLYFLAKKQISKSLLPKLIFIFILGAWQGFLGWYMVKSGLVNQPYVSHIRLAIHLMNALITFGYIFWVTLDLKREHTLERNFASPAIKQLSIFTFIVLNIQIIYGAFVAGLKAGLIYNTWPKMGNEWIATTVHNAVHQHGWLSLVEDRPTIQFIHRTVAILVLILVYYIWSNRHKHKWVLNDRQKQATSYAMVFLSIQVLLGIFTLLYHVPIWLGVVHQAGAFFIFAAMLYQIHCLVKTTKK